MSEQVENPASKAGGAGSDEAAVDRTVLSDAGLDGAALACARLDVLVARLHEQLGIRGQSVAVAESMTGGLVSAALSSTPGASATFRGGLVVYATDLKASLAGVSERLLARKGAVDPAVAIELARGARSRLSATWGVGVTGVAGPAAQDGQPVGTVFIAIVGGRQAGETLAELAVPGERNMIRKQTVEHVVARLLNVVQREPI